MTPRHALALLFTLLVGLPAAAVESHSGMIAFDDPGSGIAGELWFTALHPGETTSTTTNFTTYTQAASSDFTYLYYLENQSATGTTVGACDTHCFIGLDLDLLFDPNNGDITLFSHDAGNGGEAPSFAEADSVFNAISYEFDGSTNEGIPSNGGFSAWLVVRSPRAPSSAGGAFITNDNFASGDDFFQISSGVTTPVPEPASGGLLALGLLALAARRRAWRRRPSRAGP